MFARIEKEISKSEIIRYKINPEYFGLNIFNELERKVVRTGILYIAKVDINEAKKFDGNWKIFQGFEEEIVKHHRDIIKWVRGANPAKFVYLPPSY